MVQGRAEPGSFFDGGTLAGNGTFAYQVAFKFCDGSQDLEHEAAQVVVGLNGFGETAEFAAFAFQCLQYVQQVFEASGQAIQFVDVEGVTWPDCFEEFLQFWTCAYTAGFLVKDVLCACFLQGVQLQLCVLFNAADTGISVSGHKYASSANNEPYLGDAASGPGPYPL